MTKQFKKLKDQAIPTYQAAFRYGYSALVLKEEDGKWEIRCYDSEKNQIAQSRGWVKRADAYTAVEQWAATTTVERRNAMTGKPVEVTIDTPVACDPSMDSYWSA